jgi:hypothetical protein
MENTAIAFRAISYAIEKRPGEAIPHPLVEPTYAGRAPE